MSKVAPPTKKKRRTEVIPSGAFHNSQLSTPSNRLGLQNLRLLRRNILRLALAEPLLPHALVDVVHSGYDDQRQRCREDQTEDNRRGQDVPEHRAVAADDNVGIQIAQIAILNLPIRSG